MFHENGLIGVRVVMAERSAVGVTPSGSGLRFVDCAKALTHKRLLTSDLNTHATR